MMYGQKNIKFFCEYSLYRYDISLVVGRLGER